MITQPRRFFAIATLLLAPGLAMGAQDVEDVSGTFTMPIGGSAVTGVGSSSLRWGLDVGNGKSGFDFFARSNASLTGVPTNGNPFAIGDFVHINQPIAGGTGITGARLNLSFNVGGFAFSTFFNLTLEETPNARPCEFLSPVEPCADRVTFSLPPAGNSFSFEGTNYFFSLAGFGPNADALTSAYITQEKESNRTTLWASITTRDPAVVPEPTSLALIGAGLVGLAMVRRRRHAA